jgi:recombination protein RecA
MNEEEIKELELAIAKLNKQFGAGSVFVLGNDNIQEVPRITTGALTLDIALGGGMPLGRMVEIYGPESSGKTTLALTIVAEAQKAGGRAAYIDAEHALDPVYARNIGVDWDSLVLSQPNYGEMALEVAEKLISTGAFTVVVIDSVAALTPKAEMEGSMEDQQMGALARMMNKGIRKLTPVVGNNNTLLIFINQIREKVGVMFGNPETTPGGRGLKFETSIRMEIRRQPGKEGEIHAPDGKFLGIHTICKIQKNKTDDPYLRAEFDILFGRGIDSLGCLVDVATDYGIIKKAGAWYSYNEANLGQGRQNTIEALASDLDLLQEIENKVKDGIQV